jgi:tetratricopeptide (TPR) repeat protein
VREAQPNANRVPINRARRGLSALVWPGRLTEVLLFCVVAWGQTSPSTWQDNLRKCAEAQDWSMAISIVDREIARSPHDMDVRAWRARVLMWSGKLTEAELEYHEILAVASNDPDNWMGLATVCTREGRTREALQALDRAVQLDPTRADIHAARGGALRALAATDEAKAEFTRAVELDPSYVAVRAGLLSLRGGFQHELRAGMNTGSFNFADANQDEGLTLNSRWTTRWRTSVGAYAYHWGGTNAEKGVASLTAQIPHMGALTVGGAAGHDKGIIPKNETFFDYDHGFKLQGSSLVRGLEIVYGQHWYWYTTARILTLNGTTVFYLPRDWTWSLGLTGARSQFSGTGSEWRPSGMARLGFPIAGREERRLGGNIFFAEGTENFAQVNQIGAVSSQTYGCGLRLQVTGTQDVTGFGAYQRRTENRNETSFGLSYGIHF